MSVIRSIFRYLDELDTPLQFAITFWLLLIDAVTLQLLWPWLIWLFSPYPNALWGIIAPNEEHVEDWFFHFFYWSATIGIFSFWVFNREMNFYRWFALFFVIWGSQKVLGMLLLGYLMIIGLFNDGCPTYQLKSDDDYFAECVERGKWDDRP